MPFRPIDLYLQQYNELYRSITGTTMRTFFIYFIGINFLTFLIFGVDKWKARRGKWRIPEDTLIWLSIVGGSVGALVGMYLFRHKTQKRKFNLGIPAILLSQAVLAWFLFLR